MIVFLKYLQDIMYCPNNNYREVMQILNRGISVYVHAMGFAVRVINQTVMNKIFKRHNFYESFEALIDAERSAGGKRIAALARDVWDDMLSNVVNNGMCKTPLAQEFAKLVLQTGFRTDTCVSLGVRMDPNSRRFEYRTTAAVAWATCVRHDVINGYDENLARPYNVDEDVEVTLELTPAINTLVDNGRVAEFDLVCAAEDDQNFWKTVGSGRALLAHTMATIASRKKQGQRRYKAIIMHLAKGDNRQPPLLKGARALGFVPIQSKWRINGALTPTKRDYYILQDTPGANGRIWPRKLAEAINVELCPTVSGRGLLCK